MATITRRRNCVGEASPMDIALGPVLTAEMLAQGLTCDALAERTKEIPAKIIERYALGNWVGVPIADVWLIAIALGVDAGTFFQRIHDSRQMA